jgi:hypothetical protein
MQNKMTVEDTGESAATKAPIRYGVAVSCNKCGGTHEIGISIFMTAGPAVRQSIGAFYRGKALPKNLAELANNSVTCPNTGRQSIQKSSDHIFLVPPER